MAWQFWLQVIPFVVFMAFGVFIGGFVERRHFKRLAKKEAALADIFVTNLKVLPKGCVSHQCNLVMGDVTIASDYFKTFAATIRKLIGGELRTYETLMERARRESLVRMLEQARQFGANAVINVRFGSSSISSARGRNRAAMVEMCAYGTAISLSKANSDNDESL